jgi:acetolactate synthase regulatory subunit
MAVVELQQGTSPEEFLYVVRVLRRREAAVVETAHSARIDAAEQKVEVTLRVLTPVFEATAQRLLRLDFSLPHIAEVDMRPQQISPSFEEPRQIFLQLEYGVPPVKPLTASLKPIIVSFQGAPQIRLGLSFELPRIAPLRLKLAEIGPSFERPREVSVSVDFSVPSLATASPQPGPPDASEAPLEELEEVYSEPLLRLGVVISERPVVIVARTTSFGYVEFLKRVLREIYRVRSGGLPEPKHVSTPEDLRLLLPVDVGAGRRVFVLDLSRSRAQEPEAEDLLKEKSRDLERLRDRLRELFSQEFGFFVIYGDVKGIWERALTGAVRGYASVVPSPVEVSIRPERLPLYVLLANAMWGRVSDPVLGYKRLGFRGFDEFVVWLEDEYWRRLGEVSFEVLYKTKPSAGERESELHYLAKAFVVRHLAERVGLHCVETEEGKDAAVFDVVVTCGDLQGLVVEVETLYGTGTVVHKLVETVKRAGGETVERAGKRKMWIVVPNPQAVIYLPLLLRTRRELRKEHDVEFYTLDVTSRGLVRLTDVASMLVKKWKETTKGVEEANKSLTAD